MAKTMLADIIEPSVFTSYMLERSTELSRLQASGLVQTSEELDQLASGEGRTFNMPYWNDLDGDSEELSETAALTPGKIAASQDIAVKHFRGKAWASNELQKHISGAGDPLMVVADLVASFWARDMQRTILLPTLTGMFASALASSHVRDVSIEDGDAAGDANLIGSSNIIRSAGLLGDHWDMITSIAMHSVPFQRLQELNLIETVTLEDQTTVINRFLGREVIVDDGMPKAAGSTSGFKYTTYLFGGGAIGLGNSTLDANEAVETARDSLAGDDILINRRHFILHPRGVAWTGTYAGKTPTSAELATGSNWTKKYEDKRIKVLKLVTNG